MAWHGVGCNYWQNEALSSRHSSLWLNVNNPDIFIFKIYQNPEHSRFLSFHFESRHSFGWRERALTFSARRLRYEEMRMFLNRPAHRTRQRETAVSTFLSPFSSYKGISKYQNSAAKYLCGEKSKYSTLLAGVNNLNIDGVSPLPRVASPLERRDTCESSFGWYSTQKCYQIPEAVLEHTRQ